MEPQVAEEAADSARRASLAPSKPPSVAEDLSRDAKHAAMLKRARERAKANPSNAGDFMFARRGPSGGPDPDAD